MKKIKKLIIVGCLAISSIGYAQNQVDVKDLTEDQIKSVVEEYLNKASQKIEDAKQQRLEETRLVQAEIDKSLDEAKRDKHRSSYTFAVMAVAGGATAIVSAPVAVATFGVIYLLEVAHKYCNTAEDARILQEGYKKLPEHHNDSEELIKYFAERDAAKRNRLKWY